MSLSSNSLIHFTKNKDALKGILQNNFKIFNCIETITLGGRKNAFAIPMVSFCDIPLSEIKEHISKYGNYGIGMTKEWAVRQGLNPVLYMGQTSMLSESYRLAWNNMISLEETEDEEETATTDILRYIKNYEADLTRQGETITNYRFSDEREWRYVPPFSKEYISIAHTDWYDIKENKEQADGQLEELRLTFNPEDIKYIIIAEDSEIGEFIDYLRRAKGKNYSLHEIERLTTRILTVEQIMTDI